jgi:hypothetical protein
MKPSIDLFASRFNHKLARFVALPVKVAGGARLHGWRLWHTYCIENDYTMNTMIDPSCDPTMMIYEFMIDMDRQGVRDYRNREA